MTRARDVSRLVTTPPSIYATDSEASSGFLSLSSASSTYQTKSSTGLTLLTPTSIANTGGTASIGTNGTVSFSSASAISLNDVFSTTYTHYKVVFYLVNSGFAGLQLRYRVSGSDYSGADYFTSKIYISDSFNPTKAKESSQTSSNIGPLWGGHNSYSYDIFNPFITTRTQIVGTLNSLVDFSTWETHLIGGLLNTATSYTGFTIYPSSGNFTGSISVYGYNK
jgi:hypothetical protein